MTRLRSGSKRRLTAQYAVTRVLAEAENLAVAAPRILKAVCQSLGWELGAIWRVDGDAGVLRCVATWREDSAELAELEELTCKGTFAQGVGLPGQVWQARSPAWFSDLQPNRARRLDLRRRAWRSNRPSPSPSGTTAGRSE